MHNIRKFKGFEPQIDIDSFVDESAVVIGKVFIEKNASVWPLVSIRGDLLPIYIGKNSNVQDCSTLHTTEYPHGSGQGFDIKIGENVTIGHGVVLHGCKIGNNCLIGMGSIVLDGVIVEDNVLVGAGSLVTPHKKLESGYMYIGSPVKQIRKLSKDELQDIFDNADNYISLKDEHKNSL